MRRLQGAESAERVDEDGLVARAGVAALLRFGAYERRGVLRRMLAEAEAGQALSEQRRAPGAEEDWAENEEPDAGGGPDADEETDELDLDDDAEGEGAEQEYVITDPAACRDFLLVVCNMHRWLAARPAGPLSHPSDASVEAVKALARGWAATIVHALAPGPLTLAELEAGTAGDLGRERLRSYVEDMEGVGLVEARRDPAGETRYAATEWLRDALAPLVAAARLEARWAPDHTAAPDERDVRAAFELILPRLTLPTGRSGSCRLGVELGGGGPPRLVGVTVRVESGRVASIEPGLDERADAWAVGSAAYWLEAVAEPATARVRSGGDRDLAEAVVPGLHDVLFAGNPFWEPTDLEPADPGAERRRKVAAAGPAAQLAFAASRVEEVGALRAELESRDPERVEDEIGIAVPYQIYIWEEDLGMLFGVAEEDPLVHRLADELLDLWKIWSDAQDPDEPFI